MAVARAISSVDHAGMLENLALASFMMALTVSVHLGGLLGLLWVLRDRAPKFHPHGRVGGRIGVILFVVLGIFAIHTVEIWLYAVAFWRLGAIADFESALYFSTATFTTLGYGDIVLDSKWRLFGAIEAGNGLILFGWSTAFLLSVTGRLRMLEHDWLEHPDRR
jgi:hypothetical protein